MSTYLAGFHLLGTIRPVPFRNHRRGRLIPQQLKCRDDNLPLQLRIVRLAEGIAETVRHRKGAGRLHLLRDALDERN
jgi:hypothetical protein